VDFPDDGVDLNRNWDWRWDQYDEVDPASQKYKGPFPWSEPEVRAVREFVLAERPLIVVDYHSPSTITWTNYVFYPWLSQHGRDCPDLSVMRSVAVNWADATQTAEDTPFRTITSYDTLPKEQCWIYGETGIAAYIMEIGEQCWYSGAIVDTIAARVARGSASLLDRAMCGPGVKGTVTDDVTGATLTAEVKILEMHSDDIGPRYTDSTHGQFYRPTEPGGYTIEVSCPGYETRTVGLKVDAESWSDVDVELRLLAAGGMEQPVGVNGVRISNAPGGSRVVRLDLSREEATARVDLFDSQGRRVAILGDDLAPGREYELLVPHDLADGVYLVRARTSTWEKVVRLVLLD
jgi:hypothetical protein